MRLHIACCLILVAAGGCEPTDVTSDWRRIDPPIAAAPFTLPQLDGPDVTLTALRGRIVVMDFWATWCGPCRFSLPSLEVIAKRYRDRNVSVLLVNMDEDPKKVREWVEQRYTTPILLDQEGTVAEQYHVDSLPQTFVMDTEGRIVWAHGGYGGGLEATLSQILDELLAPPKA